MLTIPPVCDAILLNVVFPHITAVRIEELSDDAGVVRICARAQADEKTCPACGNAPPEFTAGTSANSPMPRSPVGRW